MPDLSSLPNFIIAGAPKAGTSSMHHWIADHPDALGSIEKETYFFVDPGTHMHRPSAHVSAGLGAYRAQFPATAGPAPRVILEATPSYIYSRTALEQIPALPSAPRCLFILREPAAQIYSLFTYFRDNWTWVPGDMSFAGFLDAVRSGGDDFGGNELAKNALAHGRYIDYLTLWRDRLGADRIKVVTFDELLADHRELTRRVAAWTGLDPDFYDTYDFGRRNETYAPRNRSLHRANVAIRSMLPKGRAYRALRRVYRKLNTEVPRRPDEQDKALISSLRDEFAGANRSLAQAFGLDLSGWR